MLILENLLLAFEALRANKARALLTMLGIIIGIGSVITIMTLGNSLSTSVSDSMAGMGAGNITVGVQRKNKEDEIQEDGTVFLSTQSARNTSDDDLFTEEMLEAFEEEFSDKIDYLLLSESVGNGKTGDDETYAYVTVTGVNGGKLRDEDLKLLGGRSFTEEEQEQGKKVCIVSDRYVKYMFNNNTQEALGSSAEILINGRYYTYTIVGIYEYEDVSSGFRTNTSEQDQYTSLYIPVKTAKLQTHTDSGYEQFQAALADGRDAGTMVTQIENFFNMHYYRNNQDFEASAYSMEEMLETMTEMLGTVSLVIALIAGISLIVGGIGVMNIMLVSITERTKEIGTRKALGATNASIRLQFIMESVVICLCGGVLGVVLGIILGSVGASMMDVQASASVASIVISFAFSAAIGIFFGYYPANKAAKMNPIDALRYE